MAASAILLAVAIAVAVGGLLKRRRIQANVAVEAGRASKARTPERKPRRKKFSPLRAAAADDDPWDVSIAPSASVVLSEVRPSSSSVESNIELSSISEWDEGERPAPRVLEMD